MKSVQFVFFILFLIVAAFSLKVVHVVSGVSTLTKEAFAEDAEHGEQDSETHHSDEAIKDPAEETEKTEGEPPPLIQFSEEPQEDTAKEEGHHAEGEHKEGEAADGHASDDVKPPVWVEASDENIDATLVHMDLVEDLAQKRKDLDQREQELMTREALLKAAEKELDRKYQELTQLRTEMESLLKQQSEEEEARITSLVKVYEGMKAKDAARIFDTLDLDVLVAVMSRMSERRLSPILASMNPERARTVTIVLAEQKQLPKLPQN